MSSSALSALERAFVLTTYKNPKLRTKLRQVNQNVWTDSVARDISLRITSDLPILDAHILELGTQQLEEKTMNAALQEILTSAYFRNATSYSQRIIKKIQEGDVDAVELALRDIPRREGPPASVHVSEITHSLLDMLKKGSVGAKKNVTIPFPLWNNAWGGIASGSFHVIGADPGGSKSAVIEKLELATAHPDNKVRVGVMSLEMKKEFKLSRYAQHLYGPSVGPKELMAGTADLDLLKQAITELQEYSIFIDDTKYQRYGLVDAMRAMYETHGIDYFTVDFLQILSAYRGESKYDNATSNVTALFDFARETGCAVIAASQLNREGRKMAERPSMVHLEGAGTIEQLAWTVNLMYDKSKFTDTKGQSKKTWIIDKNRNGPAPVELGTFTFNGPFMDLEL